MSDLLDVITEHIKELKDLQSDSITIYCTPSFFEKLQRHWRIELMCKIGNLFGLESVRVYATSEWGKKVWKLTGLVSGVTRNVSRNVKLTSDEEFCWIQEGVC